MVIDEPEWAANRIQEGEKAIDELAKLKAAELTFEQAKEYLKSLNYTFDHGDCHSHYPYASLQRFREQDNENFKDYEYCLDEDFTMEELNALLVLLRAKNDGKF